MKAVRPVVASNGDPYLQMRSIGSNSTSGMERKEGRTDVNIEVLLSMEPWAEAKKLSVSVAVPLAPTMLRFSSPGCLILHNTVFYPCALSPQAVRIINKTIRQQIGQLRLLQNYVFCQMVVKTTFICPDLNTAAPWQLIQTVFLPLVWVMLSSHSFGGLGKTHLPFYRNFFL